MRAASVMSRLAAVAIGISALLFSKAAKLEASHEGRRAGVYDDYDGSPLDHGGIRHYDGKPCIGHPTVGVGCNLDRGNARASLAAVGANYDAVRNGLVRLTEEQIDALFESDLTAAFAELHKVVADVDSLPEAVKLVLVDMNFNMGSVAGFHNMLAAIHRRDWEGMIREMIDSDWYREVPARVRSDVAFLRAGLGLDGNGSLTSEERIKLSQMIAATTEQILGVQLEPHASDHDCG